jgi:hypothetical protein
VVSFITGFKNSMKGVGYFIGAASLTFNYYFALGILLLLVLAAMPWAIVGLSNQLGRCASICEQDKALHACGGGSPAHHRTFGVYVCLRLCVSHGAVRYVC